MKFFSIQTAVSAVFVWVVSALLTTYVYGMGEHAVVASTLGTVVYLTMLFCFIRLL